MIFYLASCNFSFLISLNLFFFDVAPYPLGNITIKNITSSSVTLSWEAPKLETGPTKYKVTAIDNETSIQPEPCETQGY